MALLLQVKISSRYLGSVRFLSIIERAKSHRNRIAISHPQDGSAFSYDTLLSQSAGLARKILGGRHDLAEQRVAFIAPPSYDYIVMMWAVWRAGGVCVPLCVSHPPKELAYAIKDSSATTILTHPSFLDKVTAATSEGLSGAKIIPVTANALEDSNGNESDGLPLVDMSRRSIIIYTSGTTGPPKGVVSTHNAIEAQVKGLVKSWAWSQNDVIYNVLPLHHVHGVVNVVTTALYSGACCELPASFDAKATWKRFRRGGLSLFMAVPTVYAKLIAEFEQEHLHVQQELTESAKRVRLMVSGSAALPDPIMNRWREVSGHTLLERYGMTEIGMALTNPLHGLRRPGFVGLPFPNVEVKIVAEDGEYPDPHLTNIDKELTGDLRVRGPNVFTEYLGKKEATAKEFDAEGYFKTGDVALYSPAFQSYKILGRLSADIIKSGGYKLSALDIERILLAHPNVLECAVVGVPDSIWGQRVAALIVLRDETQSLSLDALKEFARSHLAPYQLPTVLKIVQSIPKNAMGKVNKKSLVPLFDN